MGADGFPDLHTAHILLGHIPDYLAHMDDFPVGESDEFADGIDLVYVVAPVLLHVFGQGKQIIVHGHLAGFPVNGLVITDLKLQPGHGRLFGRNIDALQIEITVCSPEVLDVKAFDLDLLHQPFVVGIQGIQHIHQGMVLLMGGGVVQAEERVEFPEALLGGVASHLLGFIQNDDGAVGLNDVDGLTAAKIIQLSADAAGILAPGVERLDIDDHDVNVRVLAVVVNFSQVLGVIDEETGLLAVVLHEMLLHGLKAFAHTFTDGNGGHHHDELAPAIQLVQFKHGFDVHIGLASPGFHLHVQGAGAETAGQGLGRGYVVPALDAVHICQDLPGTKPHLVIGKAHIQFIVGDLQVGEIPVNICIAAVGEAVVEGLTGKNTRHAVHSLCLVWLYGEFEFHVCHYNTFLWVLGL